jgi:hypothetical protein
MSVLGFVDSLVSSRSSSYVVHVSCSGVGKVR